MGLSSGYGRLWLLSGGGMERLPVQTASQLHVHDSGACNSTDNSAVVPCSGVHADWHSGCMAALTHKEHVYGQHCWGWSL